MESTACGTGAFEVVAEGIGLIHSKLTMGHGKCTSDKELNNIVDAIQAALQAERIPHAH